MKTTILISVAEKYEQQVDLLTVDIATPVTDLTAGLPLDQAFLVLEQLQPLLVKNRLGHYDQINLAYFVDSVPRLHESWHRTPTWNPGETAMTIGPGQKLYRFPPTEVSLTHFSL